MIKRMSAVRGFEGEEHPLESQELECELPEGRDAGATYCQSSAPHALTGATMNGGSESPSPGCRVEWLVGLPVFSFLGSYKPGLPSKPLLLCIWKACVQDWGWHLAGPGTQHFPAALHACVCKDTLL